MAVVVRLRRMGTNKQPFFRVVAADERCSNKGRFLETLGWYNPRKEGVNYDLNLERIDYWKGVGARTTETVDSLIKKARSGDKRPEAAQPNTTGKVRKISDLPEEPAEATADQAQVEEEPAAAAEADGEAASVETADAEETDQANVGEAGATEAQDEETVASQPDEGAEPAEAKKEESEAASAASEEEAGEEDKEESS